MRLSLCDILNYPPHYRDQLLQLWSEERDRQLAARKREAARRQRRIDKARAKANPHHALPEGYYNYYTDGRFYFGFPVGMRLILTTIGETDWISGVPIINLPEDHPLILEQQPQPEPEPEPVTIPMPRVEPSPPIPASAPPPEAMSAGLAGALLEIIRFLLHTLGIHQSSVTPGNRFPTMRGFPLSRAGPPNTPPSGPRGATSWIFSQSTICQLPSPRRRRTPRPDRPAKPGGLPIFDRTFLGGAISLSLLRSLKLREPHAAEQRATSTPSLPDTPKPFSQRMCVLGMR